MKIGKQCRRRVLSESEFEIELKAKLKEELAKLLATETSKDSYEEIANLHNATLEDIEQVRQMKEKERGGFQERIFLIDVDAELSKVKLITEFLSFIQECSCTIATSLNMKMQG